MVALSTGSNASGPVVRLDRFAYAYPGMTDWVLREISLSIGPGQCHLVQGPTGAGKSTLLLAIRGLLPPGRQSGTLAIHTGSDAASAGSGVGLVRQNPKTQLLCTSLGAEVAFGLENHRVAPSEMPDRVRAALAEVGLRRSLNHSVDALSMGQQYRACIAGLLVMEPVLVMLDEPMAQLDPKGRREVLAIIRRLKRSGRAVLICDHRPKPIQTVVDRFWCLDASGRLSETGPPAHGRPVMNLAAPGAGGRPATEGSEVPVVRVNDLRLALGPNGLNLSGISFCARHGERIAVYGPNGAGKTTLIRALAGLVAPLDGTLTVLGAPPRPSRLRGRLAILFQDPRKQMFETTVFDEVAFAARRNGTPEDEIDSKVNDLLDCLGLTGLLHASPHQLSYGQTHLVGLAAVLAGDPEILLLDDPFAGLDKKCARLVVSAVSRQAEAHGTTVVWTSHEAGGLDPWVDRTITLPDPADRRAERDEPVSVRQPPHRSKARYRLGTGIMLAVCVSLSMLAFAARSGIFLVALTAVNLLLTLVFCPQPLRLLRKGAVLFLWQTALVVLLYGIRFGFPQGIASGVQVAGQLFMAFWPGLIFMSANTQSRIVRTLGRFLPSRIAFVAATCLRFLPLLLGEMQQIREAQVFRGARILTGDLKSPRYWPDWLYCLMVPTLIKTLSLSADIAMAATARDFGIHPKRTAWPGD
ncbi:ATP-binding cassette domain-containing protein [Desulfosarcina ovata]|uniref:Putative ABC transporter ATP-binding protein n=1 Tax=Desulfosarcina ovata subsp. ovata TaxID=2752305 RepID=A0A5K8AJS2_9BACT|nr:ATP-binding cassette domain-containing protein [Desulfosarcina ovata]BBO92766.1 putative ABC transporter ATP-binding protein [Desulfosarcina ovata subsp. ovata]